MSANWYDNLVEELSENIPPDAVTAKMLADKTGKNHQQIGMKMLAKWRDGELQRGKKGKEYWYWPAD